MPSFSVGKLTGGNKVVNHYLLQQNAVSLTGKLHQKITTAFFLIAKLTDIFNEYAP